MKRKIISKIFSIGFMFLMIVSMYGALAGNISAAETTGTNVTENQTGQMLATEAVRLAEEVIGAPHRMGAKGRHWDPRYGHTGGVARWATPEEVRRTGYRWRRAGRIRPGIDCSGLIMWAYNKAHNPRSGFHDPRNPVLHTRTLPQWRDTHRMQQRFTFRGPRAPTIFLNEYIKNPGRFGLLPGDPIYFLNPRPGVPSGHVAMYIGNGQIIHATIIPDRGRRGVIREPLITALRRYARDRDRFRFVGLGRVRATITT